MKAFEAVGIIFRWLHLRSLDAVWVGVVWQKIFFLQWGRTWHWKYAVILGSAIWLAYMADRLFDNLSLDKEKPITRRHQFIRNNWKAIVVIWGTLFISILIFSITNLSHTEFWGGIWLVILINLYFLLIRLSRGIPFVGSLKEIITGTLFSVGVSYFPLLILLEPSSAVYFDQIVFAVLCFSNVLLISHWDHSIDKEQEEKKLSQLSIHHDVILKLLLIGQVCASILWVISRVGIFNWALLISAVCLWILYLQAKLNGAGKLKFLIDAPLILPTLLLIIY